MTAENVAFPAPRMELPSVVCFRKDARATESNRGLQTKEIVYQSEEIGPRDVGVADGVRTSENPLCRESSENIGNSDQKRLDFQSSGNEPKKTIRGMFI